MQKSGLMDTMWDLIINGVGALIASLLGFLYLKGINAPLVNSMMTRFQTENPQFFKKIKN